MKTCTAAPPTSRSGRSPSRSRLPRDVGAEEHPRMPVAPCGLPSVKGGNRGGVVLARGRESLRGGIGSVARRRLLIRGRCRIDSPGALVHSGFVLIPRWLSWGRSLAIHPETIWAAFAILLVASSRSSRCRRPRNAPPSRGLTWQRADYDPRDAGPRSHGAVSHRLLPSEVSNFPLQLALRSRTGRRVPAPHREHGHEPRGSGVGRADRAPASLARDRGTARRRSSSTG